MSLEVLKTYLSNYPVVEGLWRFGTESGSLTQLQFLVLASFLIHLVNYTLLAIPAFILPLIPSLQKYKIQQTKPMTAADVIECLKLALYNQIFVEIPLYCGLPMTVAMLGLPFEWEKVAPWYTYAWKCFVALAIEDAYHYWVHRLFHHKSLYGYIHKVHHAFKAPFTMASEYAHPLETIILGQGFFLASVVLADHVFFLYAWVVVRMMETAEAHLGYDLPFMPTRLIPFYGGAKAHDLHHSHFNGNYSSTFTWWDKLCGTEINENDLDNEKYKEE